MASDSAAALGAGFMQTIGQQPVTKIHSIEKAILYSSTGGIGMSQLLTDRLRGVWNPAYFMNASPIEAMGKIGATIAETVKIYASNAQAFQQIGGLNALCQSLVAIAVRNGPRLFQFGNSGIPESATRELPCVALGSGQQIADPFLAFLRKILWKDRTPTIAEGRFVAAWTVRHVAETNPGGVALPLQMFCLTVVGGKPVIEPMESPEEHFQQIDAAESALRDFLLKQGAAPAAEVVAPAPSPPKQDA
jgi:hypothetical protein